jgi:hypothetical protein
MLIACPKGQAIFALTLSIYPRAEQVDAYSEKTRGLRVWIKTLFSAGIDGKPIQVSDFPVRIE